MEEEIKQPDLVEMSGEEGVKSAPKYIVPTIKLNGKEGIFYKIKVEENGTVSKTDLGNTLNLVMLKFRRKYFAFSNDSSLYTNEHNSWKDNVIVFENRKTQKGTSRKMMNQGSTKEMREQFTELRMMQVIYALYEGEVVKLLVKGKGLGGLFDYWKEFKSNEHLFEVVSKLGCTEGESQLGSYWYMTFEKGEAVADMEVVSEKMKEVFDNINKIETYYANYKPAEEEAVLDNDLGIDQEPPIDEEPVFIEQ
jgi:hypothetical protein